MCHDASPLVTPILDATILEHFDAFMAQSAAGTQPAPTALGRWASRLGFMAPQGGRLLAGGVLYSHADLSARKALLASKLVEDDWLREAMGLPEWGRESLATVLLKCSVAKEGDRAQWYQDAMAAQGLVIALIQGGMPAEIFGLTPSAAALDPGLQRRGAGAVATASREQQAWVSIRGGWFHVEEPVDVGLIDGIGPKTLGQLGVATWADVLELDERALDGAGHVGAKRKSSLLQAVERARQTRTTTPPLATVSQPLEQLRAQGIPAEARIEEVLIDLPSRPQRALREQGVNTLGELIAFCEQQRWSELRSFGMKSKAEIVDHLSTLLTLGRAAYLFGPAGEPSSLGEVVRRVMNSLSPRERRIIEARYRKAHTLEVVGKAHKLTRERVRQIEAVILTQAARRYQAVVGQLSQALRQEMERNLGACDLDTAFGLLKEPMAPYQIRLAFALMDLNVTVVDRVLLHTWDTERKLEVVVLARQALSSCPQRWLSAQDVQQCMHQELEFDLSDEAMPTFLRILGLEQHEDGLWSNPSMSGADMVAAALLEHGGIHTLEQLVHLYASRQGCMPTDLRTMYRWASTHESIYRLDRDAYLHAAHLPLPLPQLQAAARRALEALTDQTATNFHQLHARLVEAGEIEESLTPRLLYDATTRLPGVQSYRGGGLDLSLSNDHLERETLSERLALVLFAARGIASADALAAEVRRHHHYHEHSHHAALLGLACAIPLGTSTYIHRDHLPWTDRQLEHLCAAIQQVLPPSTPLGVARVLRRLPNQPILEQIQSLEHGHALLCGIIKRFDPSLRAECRSELVMHASLTRHPIEMALTHWVQSHPLFYPRDFIAYFNDYVCHRGSVQGVYLWIKKLCSKGLLLKWPRSLYQLTTAPPTTLTQLALAHPDMLADLSDYDGPMDHDARSWILALPA